uniref:Ig-like domain-containing protein n=1 Tax=Pelusios castaneus TaxID=367368 RepID=A0A8C8SM40_9SAUR
ISFPLMCLTPARSYGRTRFVSPPLNAGLFVNPGGPYPKPSISVSPAGVIPVGGNVTIRCWQHHYPGLRILLYRDGIWNYLNYTDPAGSVAEFPIPRVSREHGGSYQCRYIDISGNYSEPSDPVEIIVASEPGPASPPPAPPPARPQGVSTSPHQPMGCPDSECGGGARLRPTAGLSYPEPGPSGVGGEAGFWAWGSGTLKGISARGPDLSVAGAVCPGRTGLGAGPGLVLTARVPCADPGLPRPAIPLRPSSVPAPGANVTFRCEGPHRDVRFFLHKAGDLNPQEHVDPAGDWAEFRIPDVGRQHGGRYSCSYRPRSQPFVSSEPSDPVELLVAGEGPNSASRLPAPHADNRTPWGGDCSPVGRPEPGSVLSPRGHTKGVWHTGWCPSTAQGLPSFPLCPAGMPLSHCCASMRGRACWVGWVCLRPPFLPTAELIYPEAPISLSPVGLGVILGGAGTLRCWGQGWDLEFVLPKDGAGSAGRGNLCLGPGSARGWGCPRRTGLGDGLGLALTACLCTDPGLPRPSISLRPTWVTAPGANITIRCQGLHWDMRFFLHKAGDLNPQEHKGPAGDGTEFHIPNMGRQHGGRYSCSFRPQSELFISSEPSDPVELVVAEGPYPKPSISVSPAGVIPVGGNVTIRCWQHHYPGLRIQLYRDGIWNYLNYTDPAGSEAEFPIPSVSREHGGSYQCRYSDISGTYSEPSDPVEIIVEDPAPSLPLHAGPGVVAVPGSVSAGFWAWGSGMLEGISARGPDLSVAGAVCLGRTGLGAGPGLVLTAHVLCADPGLPRPAISLRPSSVPAPGANVTIRCEGPGRAVRFFLHKAGDLNLQEHVDPAGDWTEFRIPDVGRHHGGRYSCSYRPRSQPFVSSEPSDPMELLVADPGLPRPAISLHPSSVPAPGANVTIRCEGAALRQHVRFFLHKAGDMNTQEHVDPAGDWAEFRIPDVGRHHGGRYSCSYRPRLQPFVSSEPSDPVELLVAGEGPNSASRLPAPHADNRTPWGGDCSSVGCPEPGSVLSPRAQQRDTRPGNRDGVTGGEEGTRGSRSH